MELVAEGGAKLPRSDDPLPKSFWSEPLPKAGVDLIDLLTEIIASDRVRHTAITMLSIYDLPAGDAVQLASALVWCKDKPRNRSFVCFDQKLAVAARAVGFTPVGIV